MVVRLVEKENRKEKEEVEVEVEVEETLKPVRRFTFVPRGLFEIIAVNLSSW